MKKSEYNESDLPISNNCFKKTSAFRSCCKTSRLVKVNRSVFKCRYKTNNFKSLTKITGQQNHSWFYRHDDVSTILSSASNDLWGAILYSYQTNLHICSIYASVLFLAIMQARVSLIYIFHAISKCAVRQLSRCYSRRCRSNESKYAFQVSSGAPQD